MKTLFLTIALAMGTTALAQTTPPADPPAPPAPGEPMQTPMEGDTTIPPADPPMTEPMQSPPMQTQPAPPMAPTGPVQVMPSRSVAEAFPPPPPKAEYPVCTRTVTDGCVQRRGSPRPPGSPRDAAS